MFRLTKYIFVLLMVLTLSGCVSSKKYKASLSDIEGLNQDISSLRENLRETETELEMCRKDFDDISLRKNELDEGNAELRQKLSESAMRIKNFSSEF